jgi:hypothetical protein
MDDLSYDELRYEPPPPPTTAGPLLTGLVVLLIAVLGAPPVWNALRSGQFGPELVFYPVLGVALARLAVRRAR